MEIIFSRVEKKCKMLNIFQNCGGWECSASISRTDFDVLKYQNAVSRRLFVYVFVTGGTFTSCFCTSLQ
jgi:hypothetical protein